MGPVGGDARLHQQDDIPAPFPQFQAVQDSQFGPCVPQAIYVNGGGKVDHRSLWVIGFGVGVQQVLHVGHETPRSPWECTIPFFCHGLRAFFLSRWRTPSWDMEDANPKLDHLASQQAQGPVVMPLRRWAAGQRDQVSLTPVVQLSVPVGLGTILQNPPPTLLR